MGRRSQYIRRVAVLACIVCGSMAMAAGAGAQQPDSLRARYLLDIPARGAGRTRSWPSMNVQTPSGYGARWGDWFVGAGYQRRARYSDIQDGVIGGGFGLGNPVTALGLEIDLTSTSTVYQSFLKNDVVDFKLHRLLPGNVGLAVGWDRALHTAGTDAQSSLYAVGTKTLFRGRPKDWFSSVTATLGAGTGRFRSEDFRFVDDTAAGPAPVNLFGSIGIRVAEPMSVITEWNGQDMTIAVSLVPFATIPFVITPAMTDITGHAGDGRRFIVGAGFGFSFASF